MNSKKRFSFLLALVLACAPALGAEPEILGYTEPYRIITVSSSEAGVISEMLVKEGATVKKGDVLAKLDLGTYLAELDIARAEQKQQATRKQRLEDLTGSARATPEELDKARTDLAIKEAQVRKIEAQIENRTLRSPVDGVVTEIKRDPSESVSATQPHVLTVVQIDTLAVNFFLPPARARDLKEGGSATLTLLDSNEKISGTVEFISPVIDPASGTVRVKFVVENSARKFRAGARCTIAEDKR